MKSLKDELGSTEDNRAIFNSRKDKWLATVQRAISAPETVTPFHFDRQTCVKLNNIEWAQKQLEELEFTMDSEKQSEILARKRAKETPKESNDSGSYWFTVRIVRANDLKACDTNGLSDPYVIVTDGSREIGKTRTIYENLDPIWDDMFEIERFEDVQSEPLQLDIWDENSYTEHTVCGKAKLDLDPADFVDFVPVERWLEISPKGKLLVNITMESEKDDICYYFGKSLRRLMTSESEIITMIVAKFSELITFYVSKNTLNSLLGVKGYASMFTDIFSTQKDSTGASMLDEDMIANSLDPLFDYLNANFATLSRNLSPNLRDKVMVETWHVLLEALEGLLMPPLSDKKTPQMPLNETELTVVQIWSDAMLLFFHNDGQGISLVELKGVKYNCFFLALSYYYSADTELLKQECTDKALDSIMKLIEPVAGLNIAPRRKSEALPENGKGEKSQPIKPKFATPSIASYRSQVAQRKLKRADSSVEQSMELETILLRLLRMRGEYEFVKRILSQKTNLAVSMTA